MRYIIGQASRLGEIPRRTVGTRPDSRGEQHPERAINPVLVQQAREQYIKVFGDTHPQDRSVVCRLGEGQSTGESLGKHGQGIHKPSLTSPADVPFRDFCPRWCKTYRARCQYDCGVKRNDG